MEKSRFSAQLQPPVYQYSYPPLPNRQISNKNEKSFYRDDDINFSHRLSRKRLKVRIVIAVVAFVILFTVAFLWFINQGSSDDPPTNNTSSTDDSGITEDPTAGNTDSGKVKVPDHENIIVKNIIVKSSHADEPQIEATASPPKDSDESKPERTPPVSESAGPQASYDSNEDDQEIAAATPSDSPSEVKVKE